MITTMPPLKIKKWLQSKAEVKAEPGPFSRVEFFVEMNGEKFHFMHLTKMGQFFIAYQLKPFIWGNQVELTNGMPNSCPIKRDDVLRNERLLNQFFNAFIKELKMKFDKVKKDR